jgi:hypothetical protein
VRFPWYAGLACLLVLLTAAPSGHLLSDAQTVIAQEEQPRPESTKPAAQVQPSDDALRRFDRTYFEPPEALHFQQSFVIADTAPVDRWLQPSSVPFTLSLARAPPASC